MGTEADIGIPVGYGDPKCAGGWLPGTDTCLVGMGGSSLER